MRYAGKDISPPPPATASMYPARKTRGQTIKKCVGVSSIRFTPLHGFPKQHIILKRNGKPAAVKQPAQV